MALGAQQVDLGRLEDAEATLRSVLDLDVDDRAVRSLLAQVYRRMNRIADAEYFEDS